MSKTNERKMSLSPTASASPDPRSSGSNTGGGKQQQRRTARHTGQRGGRGLRRVRSSLSIARGPRSSSRVDRAGTTVTRSSLMSGQCGAGGMPRVASSAGIYSSMTPDCPVRFNSICFDHEESDSYDDSSHSHSDGGGSMEVMDLRLRRQSLSGTDHSISLVSFGSRSSLDSEDKLNLSSSLKISARFIMKHGIINEHDGVFPVASHAISGSNKGHSEGGDAVRRGGKNGMPKHWAQPEESVAGPALDNKPEGRCLTVTFKRSRLSDFAPRNLGDAGHVSDSDSEGGNSTWSNASPLTDDGVKGRPRGTSYVHKWAWALTGFVVLVVFSGSVIGYLVPLGDRKWMSEFLLANHHLTTLLDRPQLVHREMSIQHQQEYDLGTEETDFARLHP